MIAFGVAVVVSLVVSLVGTPIFIQFLRRREYGQFIRQDGPTAHLTKRGTPTMGGVVIILATVLGWGASTLVRQQAPSVSALLLLFLFCGLGLIGFLDDFIKISKQRSLGLKPWSKILGQGLVGTLFALGCMTRPDERGNRPASTMISVVRDIPATDAMKWGLPVAIICMIIWVNFLVAAWSNGTNLTDGLDGLATGSSLFAFGAYAIIGLWQSYQRCPVLDHEVARACYDVRDPYDMAIIAAAIVGACFGFLWWNTSPAQIFMGDTGSLALGGAFAGLSILTHTEFLAVVIGGLFVVIVMSDVIQVGVFKMTHKRVFKMAPLHHHFELKGWPEVTIVVRFWIIAGLFAVLGLALFYAEWVVSTQ
ncbi:MAG: phospho-N-acetylmuramoyl-pentapeptide-transferase [Actinomycetaceae bacterium]|nr:phospho-N-acetylmuramoyl-pentapeptide-transferase [Actinomycetaceae bacterium]MDU0970039.1 phospho-N-acetylmuramoyl-pentapeptide-transferase [Actinomycetaceae bacterium]